MFALSLKTIGIAVGVAVIATVLLFTLTTQVSPAVAQACYLTMMLLISAARADSLKTRLISAG